MSTEISDNLRQKIRKRASNRCEYCLLPQSAAFHKHEPDHIIPLQHNGKTIESNLALSCMRCNRYKGPNVGSFDPLSGILVSLFNPRIHNWDDHFELEGAIIHPLTPEARVTVKLLRMNDEERVLERHRLLTAGIYG